MALEMKDAMLARLTLRQSMGIKMEKLKIQDWKSEFSLRKRIIHREVNLGARPVVQPKKCKRVFHMSLLKSLLRADALCLGLRPG